MAESVNIEVLIDATKGVKSLGQLEGIVEDLNEGIRQSETELGKLNKKVDDLNKELKNTEKGSKEFQKITAEIKKTETEIGSLTKGIEGLENAVESSSSTALDLALNIDKSTATIGELERSIEIINKELLETERGSQAWSRLSGELIQANRELKNIDLSLEALDTEQVASELGSVTGAIGDVTSAFILLGGEGNETLEEIGQRLETAIGISIGVKGAIEGIQSGIKLYKNFSNQLKEANVLLKAQAAGQAVLNGLQKTFAFVTGAGTKALKLFRGALIATGIGAVVVLIGTLISKWEELSAAISFTSDEQRALSDTVDDYRQGAVEAIKVTNEVESAFELARQGVISKEEALNTYNSKLGDTFGTAKDLNEAEALFVEKTAAYIEATAKRAQADALFAKAAEEQANSVTARTEDQTGFFDKIFASQTLLVSGTEAAEKQIADAQRRGVKDAEDSANKKAKIYEDLAKDLLLEAENIENANEIISNSEKESAEELERQQEEANRKRQQAAADAKRAQDAAKARARELLEFDRQVEDARLENLEDGIEKERKILEVNFRRQREDLLSNEKIKEEQRQALLAELKIKEAQDLKDLNERFNQDVEAIEEEFFQASLTREEDRQARQLTLQFEANRKRIEELVKDDEKLKILLKANEEKFFKDLQTIEDNARKLDEKQRQDLIDSTRATTKEIELIEKRSELEKLSERERAGEEGLKIIDEINDIRIQQIEDQTQVELRKLREKFEDEKKIYQEQGKDLSELTEKFAKDRELIEKKSADQTLQISQETSDLREEQQKATNEALFQLAQDAAQQIADASFEIIQANAERESEVRIGKLEETFSIEKDRLNQKIEDGLITQAESDRKEAELERKKNKAILAEQKRLFEETKKRQRTQAVINGALAFTNALASTQPLVPLGLIAGAGVLISTGLQIAKIDSQKFARGGVLSGPSHSQGGIKTRFGELEGGEAVINKRSTKMFKGTLSQINQAGGGVRFASGGILGSNEAQSTTQSGGDLGGVLTSLNDTLSRPIRSFVVETDVSETQKRVSRLEKNADL